MPGSRTPEAHTAGAGPPTPSHTTYLHVALTSPRLRCPGRAADPRPSAALARHPTPRRPASVGRPAYRRILHSICYTTHSPQQRGHAPGESWPAYKDVGFFFQSTSANSTCVTIKRLWQTHKEMLTTTRALFPEYNPLLTVVPIDIHSLDGHVGPFILHALPLQHLGEPCVRPHRHSSARCETCQVRQALEQVRPCNT